jgi:hypothetical protein
MLVTNGLLPMQAGEMKTAARVAKTNKTEGEFRLRGTPMQYFAILFHEC